YCGGNWWSYDTPSTIQTKMNYVKQQGLTGAFFWELSGDTTDGELIRAIDNGLN
ncbi:MAG: glycosyl hydrolase family 18 protein, partial [Reinekea sp.]|nr:glycosyl hydrolase family 18 protein [Reinekea sp.]